MSASIWMHQTVADRFTPAILNYTDLLLNRFLPVFNDLAGEQERATQNAYENLSQHEDHIDALEISYDIGMDHVLMFMEMRNTFLATGVAGLFHLFEKQVYTHFNHELRDYILKQKNGKPFVLDRWSRADDIIKSFNKISRLEGQALQEAWNNRDLIELHEVANTVKHGPGAALEKLKAMNAPVIDPERFKNDRHLICFTNADVPLAIKAEDVERYRDSILAFWKVRGFFGLTD